MKSITFKYADQLSNWEWRTQHCVVESVEECKRIYGLGVDCEYEILEVKDMEKKPKKSTITLDEFGGMMSIPIIHM